MTIFEALRSSGSLLTRRDQILYFVFVGMQILVSLLDLVGVLLFGVVGAMAVSVVQSGPLPEQVQTLQAAIGLQNLSPQALVAVVAGIAGGALFAKTVIAFILLRGMLRFLAHRQALVSGRLTHAWLSLDLSSIRSRKTQEIAVALTAGVAAGTTGVLGSFAVLIAEGALLMLLGVALLFVDPLVSLGAVAYFGAIALIMHRALGRRTQELSRDLSHLEISSYTTIQEALSSFKELSVLGRLNEFADRFTNARWSAARRLAQRELLGQTPKFVLEGGLVIGGLALAGVLLATQNATTAIGSLALYLVAASRIMPALLRLQGSLLMLKASSGIATPTYSLNHYLQGLPCKSKAKLNYPSQDKNTGMPQVSSFVPSVEINKVSFAYSGSHEPLLRDISLHVTPGTSLAIVGASGAGKSTMVDLMLGLLEPSSGSVLISGVTPRIAISKWPGSIAYVPQEISVVSGSILENICIGMSEEEIDRSKAAEVLKVAHLGEFLDDPRGLNRPLTHLGPALSGGQRQRLGVARALYSNPSLIVLDEATSALDALTERSVTDFVLSLKPEVTVVLIAHRLSSLGAVDQVAFLENGELTSMQTLGELQKRFPNLEAMVKAMGFEE